MKIAICDDNIDFDYNAKLKEMLSKYMSDNQIDTCEIDTYTSGRDLIKKFKSSLYNFVFLDIEMPKINGFEIADYIKNSDRRTNIIFVTNNEEYVFESFKYDPRAFLRKPINHDQLSELMDRLIDELKQRKPGNAYKYEVTSKSEGRFELNLAEVLYFQNEHNYVHAITTNGNYTFRSSMKKISEDLNDKGFIQISR